MKYLKTFENLDEPQIGDYVICKIVPDPHYNLDASTIRAFKKLNDFFMYNIGIITNIDNNFKGWDKPRIEVTYYNIPFTITYLFEKSTIGVTIDNIEFFSPDFDKTKSMLKIINDTNKYNL